MESYMTEVILMSHCWNLGPNSYLQNRLVRWGVPPLYKLFSRVLSIRCGTKSTPSKISQHKATRGRSQLRWDYQHTPSRSGWDFQQSYSWNLDYILLNSCFCATIVLDTLITLSYFWWDVLVYSNVWLICQLCRYILVNGSFYLLLCVYACINSIILCHCNIHP